MTEAERAIREALPFATPGRWEHVFSNGGREHYVYAPDAHYRRDLPGPVKVAWLPPSPGSNRDANDAAYIAACSPENIAALLAELDAVRIENAKLADRDEREAALRAEVEALRAENVLLQNERAESRMLVEMLESRGVKVMDVLGGALDAALAQAKEKR